MPALTCPPTSTTNQADARPFLQVCRRPASGASRRCADSDSHSNQSRARPGQANEVDIVVNSAVAGRWLLASTGWQHGR
ncbi:MAG: hypothetical protein HYZ49_09575 [Chloroflexi bacterium]|nr:hypothetical protein [Chloroflexota bacterium]